MDGKCYLCDHGFVRGEEPWLIFEKRLSEAGTVEPSLADILCTILQQEHKLDEQTAHSPYLCDSCNADVMEYVSLEQQLKAVQTRILEYYRQNVTLAQLKDHLYIDAQSVSVSEDVKVLNDCLNLNEIQENKEMLGDLIEVVPDESIRACSLITLDDDLNFGVLDEHIPSVVFNLPDNLSTLPDICNENIDIEKYIQDKEDLIIYDMYEEDNIEQGEMKQAMKYESNLNVEILAIPNIEQNGDEILSTNCSDAISLNIIEDESNVHDALIQDTTYKAVGEKYENSFLCNLCNSFFPLDQSTIKNHFNQLHQSKCYICDICTKGYVKMIELEDHYEQEHVPEDSSYKCYERLGIFGNSRLLPLRKNKGSNRGKSHECGLCGKVYKSKSILTEHMNIHTNQRPYKCNECSKEFASKYTLQTHVKTHTERERPFQCDICNKSFFNKQNLKQHIQLHAPVKTFKCDICMKAFVTQHNLNVHKIVHTGKKPFICRICNKAFARRPEIKDHERIHTGEKPFKCDLCPNRFSQRSNLISHKKHTHFNEKLHKCDMCHSSFKRKRLLTYHVWTVHTGERPLICETCGAGFVYPEHFKKHLLTHSGTKPFACEICGKQFASRDNRNAHRFIHSRKKQYECINCGSGFMRKPLLLGHMKSSKHISDTIIINHPKFLKELEDSINDENGNIIKCDTDISNGAKFVQFIPKFHTINYASILKIKGSDKSFVVKTETENNDFTNYDAVDIKYSEFGEFIENVDNETLDWINLPLNNYTNGNEE